MPKNNKLSCSLETQLKISKALKDLMQTKSFDKISISDITNACGIHRQTFYYHFVDKYELLDWIVYYELVEPLTDNFNLDNMYQHIENMFATMASQQNFYQNALRISVDEVSRYIGNVAVNQVSGVVASIEKENGVKTIDTNNNIMAEFIGYGIVGVIFSWAQHGMKDSPAVMTERIKSIVDACKKIALGRENKNN